jgi:hypothetical protein
MLSLNRQIRKYYRIRRNENRASIRPNKGFIGWLEARYYRRGMLFIAGIFLYVGTDKFLKQGQDFAGFCMTADCFLGEEHLTIHFDIKNPFCAHNQGEVVDNVLVILEQIGRRPDGPFAVVSRYAVGQRNIVLLVHFILLFSVGLISQQALDIYRTPIFEYTKNGRLSLKS